MLKMTGCENLHFRLRKGGRVQRYHTEPALRRQTVAEHSWGVAMVARQLWPQDHALREAALVHDLAEHTVGDVPANCKWQFPAVKRAMREAERTVEAELKISPISEETASRLRYCDLIECLWFCLEERISGVRDAGTIFTRVMVHLKEMNEEHPWPEVVVKHLQELHEVHNLV